MATTTDAPRISVVLPTHNRAATLPRAVRSVLAQSFTDFELIVVDDGSTDGSIEALQASIDDPRLRCIRTARPRSGPSAARNCGVAAARAEWIAFQDSDDGWRAEKLAHQWQFHLDHPDCDLIACDVQTFDLDGTPLQRRANDFDALTADPAGVLLRPLRFPTPTWLVRRTAFVALGGFDETLVSSEDWELCLRLASHSRFGGVPERLVEKFTTPMSVYGSGARRHAGMVQLLHKHAPRWQGAAGRAALRDLAIANAEVLLAQNRRRLAAYWVAQTLRADPTNPRGLTLLLRLLAGERLYRWQQRLRGRSGV